MKRTLLSSAILVPALALAALLAPGLASAAGPIDPGPNPACTDSGATVTCDLWAKTGTVSLPGGGSATIWGFAAGAALPAKVPGPVLIADAGDQVTVTLHNTLSRPASIQFGGQPAVSDITGAPASGGTKTYTFTAGDPGTYLYEAGLVPGAEYQVAMGLAGALVVRPAGAPMQANADPATAFDDEALVVLGEIDPALNASSTPWTFDLRAFAPKWFLVNGTAYSSAAPSITTTGGNDLLLRYVNAGIGHHSIGALGLPQRMLASDGSPLPAPRAMVADTLAPGQTADVLAAVPATAATSTKYAIYDAAMLLNNSNVNVGSAYGIGGMLALVDAAGTPPGSDTTGPVTSGVTLTSTGPTTYTLTATVDDTATGGATIGAAEYKIDSGSAAPVTADDLAFDEIAELVTTAPGAIDTSTWTSGTHTVYVRGQDSLGNWGAFAATSITLDKAGPTVSGLTLTPGTGGTTVVAGTASDVTSGNSNVTAAEWFIGATGADGTGTAMSLNHVATVAAITGTIASGQTGLVSVHAKDAAGNWGPFASIDLSIDATGPTTTGVTASPNPNSGTLGVSSSNPSVRITAMVDDTVSGASVVTAAEGFIDTLGAPGTGFVFVASDGVFNEASEDVLADIPLTTINLLGVGSHTIHVRGRDASGNWGAASTTSLVIEKTPPTIISLDRVDPTPTTAYSVAFLVTFSEDVVGVASTNFTVVGGGGLTGASITSVTGTGATRTVTVSTGSNGGTLGLNLTSATGIRDVAGNALPAAGLPFVGQVYTVITPLYFSTSGGTNPPGVAGTADDADIYFWDGSAFSRAIDVTTAPYSLPTGANVDGFDRDGATNFYASFNGNVTVPGIAGTVADEDVVHWNGSAWSLSYDGSANGLAGTDLDAIDIVGGTLYFSTDDTDIPPGVAGSGDDADIYSWNGSAYARVQDASALGWSTANVDGLGWVDATHLYLSYSADTTVPGLGTIQDEDVVALSGTTWTVYFDGTAKGLTAGNLDVDAFDLP